MSSATEVLRREAETRAESIYSEYMGGSLLEIHFADLIVPTSPETESFRRQEAVRELVQVFRGLEDKAEALVSYVLKWRQRSEAAHVLVNDLINAILSYQILTLRSVCECLLVTSADLNIDNEQIWRKTLQFIDRSISKLDYKGVRDVLKLIFEHISNCPMNFRTEKRKSHTLIEDLIIKICDRKNNLLPAYFIVNEMRKLYAEPKCFPHWRLADCFNGIVESFRHLAQMVTITGRSYMLPAPGHFGLHLNTTWKLDPTTLKLCTKGTLPFPAEVSQPQSYLIHEIFLQPSFRELLNIVLSLQNKTPRCSLEEIFISTVLELMAEVESEGKQLRHIWSTLSNVLVFLVINFLINFPKMAKSLQFKLAILPYRKARDDLMWLLLQCLSAIVTKQITIEDVGTIVELYRTLYTGSEEFSVSESDPSCVYMMAATCIWVMILERIKDPACDPNVARQQGKNIDLEVPPSINTQMTFLQKSKNKAQLAPDSYMFATFCNAYSTSKETFQLELAPMITDFLEGGRSANAPAVSPVSLPGGLLADGKTCPLKIEFLDSVTVHVRVSIMQNLLELLLKYSQQKTQLYISPAVVETYARLLSYSDIDNISLNKFWIRLIVDGYKAAVADKQMFLQQQHQQQQSGVAMQPQITKNGIAEIAHLACEIICYRLFQIPANYRVQFANVLQQMASLLGGNVQLYWMIQSTIARQMSWIPLCDVIQPAFIKFLCPMKDGTRSVFTENEEISKLIVLAVAKAYVVSGGEGLPDDGYRNLLTQLAGHHWSNGTLQFFPPQLASFFLNSNVGGAQTLTSRQLFRNAVEQDYIKMWRSAGSDTVLLEHFTRQPSHMWFLCIVWRHLFENGDLPVIAYRILHELGPKILSAQLSNLIDYILVDITGHNLQQCVECLGKMVWKYAIMPLEWLIYAAVLRPYDGNDAFYAVLIAFLLLQNEEFLTRAQECCSMMTSEFWRHGHELYEKHMSYHQKFPEKYWSNVLSDQFRGSINLSVMPVYFGNVCFAVLPALDLLLQKIIELPEAQDKVFRKLMETLSPLYKFHPQPIGFLYNTLRFYDKRLQEKTEIKQKLVYYIHCAVASVRGDNWLLTSDMIRYLQSNTAGVEWPLDLDYFAGVLKRLVDCVSSGAILEFSPAQRHLTADWRFCEYCAPQPYALHAVAVELMTLPCSTADVGASLINIFLQCHPTISRKEVNRWLNAIGLVFSSLPIGYCDMLYERLAEVMNAGDLEYWLEKGQFFAKLNFEHQWSLTEDTLFCRLMALAHSIWLQVPIGYLNALPQKLKEKLKPLVSTEAQFLYVCYLIGPFLQRLHQERAKMAMDVATDLYEMLLNVDRNSASNLRHEDTICDLLYHMKYMYVGDGIRADTDRIIPQFKSSTLQNKLRFITHHQMDGLSSMPPSNIQ